MTGAALRASGLIRAYRVAGAFGRARGLRKAVDAASLEVTAGETLGLVGESGCGKSTLARLLCLVETPDAGSLYIEGVDALATSGDARRALHRKVQLVFQNPAGALNPRHRVGTILAEPLAVQRIGSAAERAERVARALHDVGLPQESVGRYPHMFSGGQKQRIAIARALILEPSILVADEPVSALDLSVQAQILDLFLDIRERTRLATVFVSHDLAVVRHVSHRIAVMYLGRIVEVGATAQILSSPAHPYTRALVASTPRLGGVARATSSSLKGEPPDSARIPPGCAFHPRCPLAVERCRVEVPVLRAGADRRVACHLA